MARIRIIQELVDVMLSAGVVVESDGPVTEEMQDWLDNGEAELIDNEPSPPPLPS